jgi:hypothetical protein
MPLARPHRADGDDGAAPAPGDHARDDGLRHEEQCAVQFVVRVVEGFIVLAERLRDEETRGVDEQDRVGVLGGELLRTSGAWSRSVARP